MKLKKCLNCNNIFDRPFRSKNVRFKITWNSYYKRKFCSNKCRSEHHSKFLFKSYNPNWKGGKTRCCICNKELACRYSYRKTKYCKDCWYKFNSGKNHCNWKGGKIKKICLTCNMEFKTTKFAIKNGNGKYCSRKCFGLSEEMRNKISLTNRGKNCHFWKGGITPLNKILRASKEFKHWREKVFERDNWTCWICEKRGSVKLHPHHLKKFSDYPKLRFEINNGLTLCEFCHKTYTDFRH